jgi:prepilin-type N-terminal cleavage/methylation domain-containing protein
MIPTGKTSKQAGFSMVEMLVVIAVLTIVMGALFQQIDGMQKRYKAEESKLDLAQESREFMDQLVRDLHSSGYPNAKMYGTGILLPTTNPENDSRNAVGLVKFAYDEVWIEGDVDGDGNVDVVNYKLAPDDVSGKCPCKISRSQVLKVNATPPLSQTVSPFTELQGVINSGGSNGSASGAAGYTIAGTSVVSGSAIANDTLYGDYKTANVFIAYDGNGNTVAPTDYSTTAGKNALKTIRTVKINVNVLAKQQDLQTGMRPAIPFVASARIPAN